MTRAKTNTWELMAATDVAKMLGVSSTWVRVHSKHNARLRIPCVRLGGIWRYDPDAVRAWVKDLERKDATV
ncbi:MAG: helix-turn-helix domain-containing protein [Acidobacteriota bacterium]|nr:helix-turn-helix domain-containing protein [Acidobacteriota bacterium]